MEDLDKILNSPTEWHYALDDDDPFWIEWEERETDEKEKRAGALLGMSGG